MSDFDALLKEAEAVQASMTANPPPPARAAVPPPQPLSAMDKLLAKVPAGLVNNPVMTALRGVTMGMADPAVGAGQLAANVLPDSTGIPQAVNQAIKAKNESYQAERGASANTLDPARIAGNIGSPANLAMALRAAPAMTAGQAAIQGAKFGLVGGATAPIEEGEKFWGPKTVQTGVGTVFGAGLGPIVKIVGDRIAQVANRGASVDVDALIKSAAAEAGQKLEDIPAAQMQTLRAQVQGALAQGKKLDAPAALRKADFDAEGIAPTLGQITRDPMQWAGEQNIRGVAGVGEPLTQRLSTGNRDVMQRIGQYGMQADEAPGASKTLADALRQFDEGKRSAVTDAYKAARASAGKDLEIPMQDLAQTYADVVHRYAEKVPGGVRNAFEDFGLSSGTQKKVFTFEEADKLLKTINANASADPATQNALKELRAAVKGAQTSVDASGGPYAPAVKLAAERFKLHDDVPALEAAARGEVDDTFVQKYVIGSKSTDQVKRLADLLRTEAPEAYQQTRAQIGAELARKAFGENAAGDKPIAQESYNRALRNIGTAKLEAFFEPQEVEQLKRLGRIGAYQVQPPAAAASNYSNTASALANLLRAGGKLPIAGKPLQFGGDFLERQSAMKAEVPVTPNLTDAQRLALSRALSALSGGGGLALSSRLVGQ